MTIFTSKLAMLQAHLESMDESKQRRIARCLHHMLEAWREQRGHGAGALARDRMNWSWALLVTYRDGDGQAPAELPHDDRQWCETQWEIVRARMQACMEGDNAQGSTGASSSHEVPMPTAVIQVGDSVEHSWGLSMCDGRVATERVQCRDGQEEHLRTSQWRKSRSYEALKFMKEKPSSGKNNKTWNDGKDCRPAGQGHGTNGR